jgi:DMSO/TMAO reductase YedYZ heme-binding membrane subunit
MSYRRWHRFHWWAYGGFGLITLHTVLASREKHFSLIVAAIAATIAISVCMVVIRLISSVSRSADPEYWFDVVEDSRDESYFR